MAALQGCIIADYAVSIGNNGVATPLTGEAVTASPTITPLFQRQSDGSYLLDEKPAVVAVVDATGLWTITLPSQSNCDPTNVTWTITMPDKTVWTGAVTAAMVTASLSAPLALHQLVATYGWARTSTTTATGAATTVALGLVLVDQTPVSGNPIALTQPRLGAASGVCDLDSSTKVPLSRMPVGLALTGVSNIFTQPQTIAATSATTTPLTTKGADSQNAPLQLWEDSTGGVLASVDAAGNITTTAAFHLDPDNYLQHPFNSTMNVVTFHGLNLTNNAGGSSPTLSVVNATAGQQAVVVRGAPSQVADLQAWQDSAGHAQLAVSNVGTGASPVWALKARAVANAESMAQTHTLGAYSGRSIQLVDDAGATIGWLPIYT